MAHRTLTDPAGDTWHVWAVHPTVRPDGPAPAAFAPGYAEGWLVFERLPAGGPAGGIPVDGTVPEKRRHAPVPPEWDRSSDAQLAAWLAAAPPVVPSGARRRAAEPGATVPVAARPSTPPTA